MKLLLLTSMPPCLNNTAGMVLAQACRLLPPGSVACLSIIDPACDRIEADPALAWLPIEYIARPREAGLTPGSHPVLRRTREMQAYCTERVRRFATQAGLITLAVDFARRHRVDAIWAVLEGHTIVRVAAGLADATGLKLFSQVWDPPSWWLDAHHVDRWHRRRALADFEALLRRSAACATASWAMAAEYRNRFGVPSAPLIASHDRTVAFAAAASPNRVDRLVIGMAGQFYALREWHTLIRALDLTQWRVAGREVSLMVLGHGSPPEAADRLNPAESRVRWLGWRPQAEAIALLAREADVLYCPYPSDPERDEVSRLSFPSKLVAYLAAGRPVILHGSANASPARYLVRRDAGLLTVGVGVSAIYNALHRLATDTELYARLSESGARAFAADFTTERMRASLLHFLGLPKSSLRPVISVPAAPVAAPPRPVTSGARKARRLIWQQARRVAILRPAADLISAIVEQHRVDAAKRLSKQTAALEHVTRSSIETLAAALAVRNAELDASVAALQHRVDELVGSLTDRVTLVEQAQGNRTAPRVRGQRAVAAAEWSQARRDPARKGVALNGVAIIRH